MIRFRTATPADREALYRTWAECFDAPHVVPLYESDPGRYGRTFVAAGDDGIHAVVYYVPRRIRNASGGTDLVGGVADVATRPDARGRGHVRRLLGMAVDDMAAAGCAWSLLFTGTPGVYAGSGWSVFELTHPAGVLARPGAADPLTRVRPATTAEWPLLAALYERHNANRPLTTVRGPDDWKVRVPVWYGPPVELTVAERGGEAVGYLAARWHPGSVEILETAGEQAALFRTVTAEAARRGVTHGSARLPADEPASAALPLLLSRVEQVVDATGMVRPILGDPAPVVGSPAAVHWPADYF
ncbi:GNAT superfamily N-acetyltransferase [Streptosporangium becharense]|uniref:GNAT superfamily N-acetyltransferase n=1 Tax=Streptosporangium becharense TaxID=1816182 RepID=A0A7W9MJL1_9ACTN|nr:GNAT family N-acetyltransferase [Streptosporangium becharense]MBB2914502.1 GNAT superfamily N-acetyltransferase [Streptosporangium becharense]MBB5823347.1 GNAT superfamily N-acetyltransferase [Streptosporangium becharense]